jgi:glucose-1-phosphate adenylyltransferase
MLLAGGQGSRLHVLTRDVAKPAVPFGGKYRIIDFPLSNCVNSDIDTVGVLTQYQPHELNAYIGAGQPWDLDRLNGGVHVLPPYQKSKNSTWYKNTANAIFQNIKFVDTYKPEYVLVLGGDHIYKMDYSKMLDFHKSTGADCTIAGYEVSREEATRMGVMLTQPDQRIYGFEEKPKQPKSTLASMGIYIFTWPKLKRYLIEDDADPKSKNDFGGDVIPKMLENGEKMMAYSFDSYWRDVGTIDAYWEANMDMLILDGGLDLFDPEWRIYGQNPNSPPHSTGERAKISHSLVTEGCVVDGTVENSVLFNDVTIHEGAQVRYSILMPGAVVEQDAVVEYAIVASDALLLRGCHVGGDASIQPDTSKIAVIGSGVQVGAGVTIAPGTIVESDVSAGEGAVE